ncbi:hypothetical protein [Streptomyces sp. NPDC005890]|uniref:DUF7620 family protein n=1 Tax=Streptomyces sp. NPDC005890 TaxID=3154568 RepID=UPI0033E10D90
MTELFGVNRVEGGAWALVTIAVLMVLTGRLVPRRTYNWRQAFHTSEEVRRMESNQVEDLLAVAEVGGRILKALPRPDEAAERCATAMQWIKRILGLGRRRAGMRASEAAVERTQQARREVEERQSIVASAMAPWWRAREENHLRERIEAAFRGAPQ